MNKTRKRGNSKENYKKGFRTEDRDLNSKTKSSDKVSSKGRDFICSEGKPTNDPKWYLNNPILSRDVGSIYFSRPTGAKFKHFGGNEKYDAGVAVLDSAITWGGGGYNDSESILNLTAQKLYQYVVHANSRNTTYDKKDLLMSCMAIDAVYAVITEAIRAYRLIAQYSPRNTYVLRLLEYAGWDPDDLKTHVAEFRYYINWAITRINKFYMPALFDIVKAHTSCYEHIYLDRPDDKSQMYIKRSAGFWLYTDELGSLEFVSNGQWGGFGNLTWYDGLNTKRSVSTFYNVVSLMISRIENSQYMGVMQGDMLKAFGPELMSNYGYIGIDMPITPVYDEEFLYKLHNGLVHYAEPNTFFVGHVTQGQDFWNAGMIYRDSDDVDGMFMMFGPTWGSGSSNIYNKLEYDLVDLPAGVEASPENVMLMSLYKFITPAGYQGPWELDGTDEVSTYYGNVPPELLLKGWVFYDPDDSSKHIDLVSFNANNADLPFKLAIASRFAVYPMLRADDGSIPLFWQTTNIAEIDSTLIYRIQKVIFWSLWSSSLINSTDVVTRDTRV